MHSIDWGMTLLTPLPIPADPNPFTTVSHRMVYDSHWIRLREDQVAHRRGAEGIYPVCGFQRTACGVVAVDAQDRVVLVGQWRYPLEQYSWELPEGGGGMDESPFEAIRRELAEEAGLEADAWEPLLYFHTSNSSTDEETFLFLATGLQELPGGHRPEDNEELALRREPFGECLSRILSGEITDSLTVSGLLALSARRSGAQGPMAPGIAERFFQRPGTHPSAGRARWSHLG